MTQHGSRALLPIDPDQPSDPSTSPAPPPARTRRTTPTTARRRGEVVYTGTAVAINRRIENRRRLPSAQVATFRLERYDDRGDRRPPISVEMRGVTITGGISDGERVRVTGRLRGGTLAATDVYSLTTGSRMSTRALSLVERRVGRRGALAVVAALLVAASVGVRFTPQLYYNTPFGKNEYRADVTGTCQRIETVQSQVLPPPLRFTLTNAHDPTSQIIYSRDAFQTVMRSRHATTTEQYRLLFARTTPIALMTRRNAVERLVSEQTRLFQQQENQAAGLPSEVSLSQIDAIMLDTLARQTDLTAQLGAAMTALAGRPCSV